MIVLCLFDLTLTSDFDAVDHELGYFYYACLGRQFGLHVTVICSGSDRSVQRIISSCNSMLSTEPCILCKSSETELLRAVTMNSLSVGGSFPSLQLAADIASPMSKSEDFHARTAQVHFLKFGYFDINIVRKFSMGSKNYTCVLVLCIRC